jgi:glycosyltransferase involved in cell wall biosynthesis
MLRDRFPQVRVYVQPHAGVSAARNRGIRSSSAAWIAFLDSDDEWLPCKIERQLDALRAKPGYRVCHSDEIWVRDGRRVNPRKRHAKQGGWIYPRCLALCCISPSAVLLHRSVFQMCGQFDESLPACEDYDLWLRVCSRMPVAFVPDPLIIKYGGHGDQLSRQHPAMDRFRVKALEKMLGEQTLTAGNRQATLDMLTSKLAILEQGARKRKNICNTYFYGNKLKYFNALNRAPLMPPGSR